MRTLIRPAITAIAAAMLVAPSPAAAQADADRTAIIAAVQSVFDAMTARSSEAAMRLVIPEGQVVSVRDDKGTGTPRSRSLKDFATSLATGKSTILERMWNPEVQIHGSIATLSTRYDFHQDGAFTHCGTDVFNMVKTAEGWKVAGLIYTVERTGCAPSPLGAPKIGDSLIGD